MDQRKGFKQSFYVLFLKLSMLMANGALKNYAQLVFNWKKGIMEIAKCSEV